MCVQRVNFEKRENRETKIKNNIVVMKKAIKATYKANVKKEKDIQMLIGGVIRNR